MPTSEQQHRKLQQIEGIGQKALDLAEKADDLEKISKGLEASKTSAEAARAYSRVDRIQFWVTIIAPLATVLVAVGAILVQNSQNHAQLLSQNTQNQATLDAQAKQLRDASEDAQWREAMKAVSFDDPSHALAGALGMLTFFDSPRHAKSARTITVSLMPMVDNVGGFDDVLTELDNNTNSTNQTDIIGVAQKVSSAQWLGFRQTNFPRGDPYTIPFVQSEVLAVDFVTPRDKRTRLDSLNIGAYEVGTTSHALFAIWKRDHRASPQKQNLTDVVLENNNFSSLDFSDAVLRNSVLANAQFCHSIFRRAIFDESHLIASKRANSENGPLNNGADLDNAGLCEQSDTYSGVRLDEADLCEVTSFVDSDWSGANWWSARCISPQLYEYLLKRFPPSSAADLEKASKSARH